MRAGPHSGSSVHMTDEGEVQPRPKLAVLPVNKATNSQLSGQRTGP